MSIRALLLWSLTVGCGHAVAQLHQALHRARDRAACSVELAVAHAALHGEGLAGASLPVREDAEAEAVHHALQQRLGVLDVPAAWQAITA